MFGKLTPVQIDTLRRAVDDRFAKVESNIQAGYTASNDSEATVKFITDITAEYAALKEIKAALEKPISKKKPGRKPRATTTETVPPIVA
jgi:hypothetical protein